MEIWEEELEMEEDMVNNGFNPYIQEEVIAYNKWVTEYLTRVMKGVTDGNKRKG